MTVPIIFFPGLDILQIIIFEGIQTTFNSIILIGLFITILKMLKHDRKYLHLRKILITVFIIEIGNVIVSIMWILFSLYVLAGFILLVVFYFTVPFFIIYLHFYEKPEMNELKIAILYLSTFPIAFFLSITITSILLNIVGIDNYFILTF